MHISPRPGGAGAVRLYVMHINVGPDTHAGAPAFIANVLSREDGGYHAVGDDVQTAIAAQPDQLVYGASGANDDGYHHCLLGDIQTPAQWADAFSTGEIHVAAAFCAQKCHELGIPPMLLTNAQVADGKTKGITDHWMVNKAIVLPAVVRGDHSMGPGDHTDVGQFFPWPLFMSLVQAFYGGTPVPGPEETMRVLVAAPTQPDLNQWRGAQIDFVPGHPCTMIALGGAVIRPALDPVEAASPCVGVDETGRGAFTIVADTPDKRNNAPYRHTVT